MWEKMPLRRSAGILSAPSDSAMSRTEIGFFCPRGSSCDRRRGARGRREAASFVGGG
jgi:hypothetical protein